MQRYSGSSQYIADENLIEAVNAAMRLGRPLLLKGDSGTGKTLLAFELARSLSYALVEWHIKSTTKAQQGLYEYDAVGRLHDSQLGHARARDIGSYIVRGPVWNAFASERPCVLLIDEIDKADLEFPNDLLREIDRMEFNVHETRTLVRARHRPAIVVTASHDKDLPSAFLRRCYFHHLAFADEAKLERIAEIEFPGMTQRLLHRALSHFLGVHGNAHGSAASAAQRLDWLKMLIAKDKASVQQQGHGAGVSCMNDASPAVERSRSRA